MDGYYLFRIKKRTAWFILSILLVFILLIAGVLLFFRNQSSSNIIVFGRMNPAAVSADLDSNQLTMGVPVVAVLQELGYTVQQQNENVIMISDGDQQFELNLQELTLYEVGGQNLNYLDSPPGDYLAWSCRDGNDVIVDCITFAGTLQLLGSKYRVKEISEHKLVIIYKRWIDLVLV